MTKQDSRYAPRLREIGFQDDPSQDPWELKFEPPMYSFLDYDNGCNTVVYDEMGKVWIAYTDRRKELEAMGIAEMPKSLMKMPAKKERSQPN